MGHSVHKTYVRIHKSIKYKHDLQENFKGKNARAHIRLRYLVLYLRLLGADQQSPLSCLFFRPILRMFTFNWILREKKNSDQGSAAE